MQLVEACITTPMKIWNPTFSHGKRDLTLFSGLHIFTDMGLAKLLPMLDRYVLSNKIPSALGCMVPGFACMTVKITEKCDVLKTISRRKPVEYVEDDVVVLCDIFWGQWMRIVLKSSILPRKNLTLHYSGGANKRTFMEPTKQPKLLQSKPEGIICDKISVKMLDQRRPKSVYRDKNSTYSRVMRRRQEGVAYSRSGSREAQVIKS
ncbi:hypothetical protein IEQ34_002379 [Dendrobium chrysotoxum]|uniref:Uncharacterized protein n=1 Tax=Dendrobium chrysotoxum TaxID=161865 RepID=A0AAV7HL64_DENCH|nr:hypothetical protein IEQ34_002379 [Dendrobium chrysotoxum]